MNNTITAISGVTVGHYTDDENKTGCTVLICEQGCVCGVDVRGAAPGTRETDLLRGENLVDKVHAIMLSGGSAFGLASACGAMRFLEERGIGFDTGFAKVPIVPAAVIYDLGVGSSKVRPGEQQGYEACQNASPQSVICGRVGCGTGATVGKMLGNEFAQSGGIGSACVRIDDDIIVAALVAVNALGDVYRDNEIISGASVNGVFPGCLNVLSAKQQAGSNTTIGIIATNAALSREEANRMACVGHDGLALSIRPVHTMYDGDTLFALSTCERKYDNKVALHCAAVAAVSKAIECAVSAGRQ